MTIFDTLRYPISDPLTTEQVRALPEGLYRKWYWEIYKAPFYIPIKDQINILRKMIAEHNTQEENIVETL